MDYAEDDWLAEFQSLLEKFNEIPIASQSFVIFINYIRALYRQYIADEKYGG